MLRCCGRVYLRETISVDCGFGAVGGAWGQIKVQRDAESVPVKKERESNRNEMNDDGDDGDRESGSEKRRSEEREERM